MPTAKLASHRRLLLSVLTLATLIVVLRGCFFRPATDFSGAHFNRGANAIWLGVEWVAEAHDEAEIVALADDLHRRQMRDVYVFVSYLKPHGEFNPTYAHAAEFVAAFKAAQPDLNVQAWIGLPLAHSTLFNSGYVDLGDPTTRQKVAAFCVDVIREAGFDGVHLDQIAVMTYDSSMPLSPLYQQWVRFHVIEISRALDGSGVDLLFGVPASEERTTSHWPSAENVGSGLRGVIAGLNDAQARPGAVSGVALYPHWELDEAEWALYETLWLGY